MTMLKGGIHIYFYAFYAEFARLKHEIFIANEKKHFTFVTFYAIYFKLINSHEHIIYHLVKYLKYWCTKTFRVVDRYDNNCLGHPVQIFSF